MLSHPEAEPAEDPIAADVVAVYEQNRRQCGTRKIKRGLAKRGINASRRRIGRIMGENGLVGAYAKAKFRPRAPKPDEADLPNILDRESDGDEPHAHVASDLTCVRAGGRWDYVCPIVDLHNREVVGRSAGGRRDARPAKSAFATLGFPISGIAVFHTDYAAKNAKPQNAHMTSLPLKTAA